MYVLSQEMIYDQQQQQQYQEGYGEQLEQQQQIEEEPSLVLTNFQSEMSEITAVAGIDYLSLAKQRAAEKRESVNNISTDNDWLSLAEEIKFKEQQGENKDEWEASLDDEGGMGDAAALGMGSYVTEGGIVVEGEDEEPSLLL